MVLDKTQNMLLKWYVILSYLLVLSVPLACSKPTPSDVSHQIAVTEPAILQVSPTSSELKHFSAFVDVSESPSLKRNEIWDISINPDANILAILANQGLMLYDAFTLKPLKKHESQPRIEPLTSITWSSDGKQLLLWSNHYDGWTAQIIDSQSGYEIQQLSGETLDARNPSWSPNGSYVAFASRDGFVYVWDIERNETLTALDAQVESGSPLIWSADGTQLAVGGLGLVSVWDTLTWQPRYKFEYDLGGPGWNWIGDMAWSPDGKSLAGIAGSSSNKWMWNIEKGIDRELPHLSSIPQAVLWSQDGTRLIFGGDIKIQVWEVATETFEMELTSPIYRISEFAWLQEKPHLITAGWNGIEIWDMENQQLVSTVSWDEE